MYDNLNIDVKTVAQQGKVYHLKMARSLLIIK